MKKAVLRIGNFLVHAAAYAVIALILFIAVILPLYVNLCWPD